MLAYNWDEAVEWIGMLAMDTRGQVRSLVGDVSRSRGMIDEYINAYRFLMNHLRRERFLQTRPQLRSQVHPLGSPIQYSTRGPYVIVRFQYFFYAVIVLRNMIYINKWRIIPTMY